MNIFADYSKFYDLLYQDKNYHAEVSYLVNLINAHGNKGKNILELGCGTGRHALLFAQQGYKIHGIDLSADMVEKAQALKSEYPQLADAMTFESADLRAVRLSQKFDVIFSLFHVMSYQVTDHDIAKALQTASYHLRDGGIFIFDFWYGPAVLHDKPTVRVKRVENEKYKVTRLTEPIICFDSHIVDVKFTVYAQDKDSKVINELQETHAMRYFFEEELTAEMKNQGLAALRFEEWLTGKKPVNTSWGVCAIGKKQ